MSATRRVQRHKAPADSSAGAVRSDTRTDAREPLTRIEQRILDFMIEYLRKNTYQPSIREIGRRFRMKSTKTVSDHLDEIARKGYLDRREGRSRAMRIVDLEVPEPGGVSVPVYTSFGALSRREPDDTLILDGRLVPPGAYVFVIPAGEFAHEGASEGDWLLLDAHAPADAEHGLFLYEHGGMVQIEPVQRADGSRCLGRVVSIFRPSSGRDWDIAGSSSRFDANGPSRVSRTACPRMTAGIV